jgi:hypothetical protein
MRRYLVDTTPLSALVTNRPAAVALITPWIRAHEAATSILVYGEVLEGLHGRPSFSRPALSPDGGPKPTRSIVRSSARQAPHQRRTSK